MFGLIPRQWRLGCLALAAAVFGLSASSALAAVHPYISLTFKAKHGWHVTVSGYGCGAKGSAVSISVTKTGTHYSFGHFYNGRPGTKSGCSGSSTLNSGKMHARWGTSFRMKMTIRGAGAKTAIPSPGCTGTLGHQRAIKAHGTLRMSIHRHVLGHISLTHAKGIMQIYDTSKNYNCPGGSSHPIKETIATGQFGTHYLSATKNDKTGKTSLYTSATDNAGKKVLGSFADVFTGGPFTYNKTLTSATIGSITSFMSGSVTFTGTSQCAPGYENGSWKTGTLKIHDGLGKVNYVGSSTAAGSLFKSNASCSTPA